MCVCVCYVFLWACVLVCRVHRGLTEHLVLLNGTLHGLETLSFTCWIDCKTHGQWVELFIVAPICCVWHVYCVHCPDTPQYPSLCTKYKRGWDKRQRTPGCTHTHTHTHTSPPPPPLTILELYMCCVVFSYSLATLLAARPSVNLIIDNEKLQNW